MSSGENLEYGGLSIVGLESLLEISQEKKPFLWEGDRRISEWVLAELGYVELGMWGGGERTPVIVTPKGHALLRKYTPKLLLQGKL